MLLDTVTRRLHPVDHFLVIGTLLIASSISAVSSSSSPARARKSAHSQRRVVAAALQGPVARQQRSHGDALDTLQQLIAIDCDRHTIDRPFDQLAALMTLPGNTDCEPLPSPPMRNSSIMVPFLPSVPSTSLNCRQALSMLSAKVVTYSQCEHGFDLRPKMCCFSAVAAPDHQRFTAIKVDVGEAATHRPHLHADVQLPRH